MVLDLCVDFVVQVVNLVVTPFEVDLGGRKLVAQLVDLLLQILEVRTRLRANVFHLGLELLIVLLSALH